MKSQTKTRGLTPRQKACLQMLREAEKCGDRWQSLSFRRQVLQALFEQDLIFESHGIDGNVKYCITGRGKQALAEAERPKYRRDGICPKCRARPRAKSKRGHQYSYCMECLRALSRRAYFARRACGSAAKSCPRCGIRARQVLASGRVSSYCAECTRAYHSIWKQKYKEQAEQKMHRCCYPGCERTVMVRESWASRFCEEHYRAHIRRLAKLRRLRAVLGGYRKEVM